MNTKHSRKNSFCYRSVLHGLCAGALALVSVAAHGFLGRNAQLHSPWFWPYGLRYPSEYLDLLASKTHESTTSDGIVRILDETWQQKRWTGSTAAARDEIVEANSRVDDDQIHSALHFDAENGLGAQRRLLALKAAIKTNLSAPTRNVSAARASLGAALHTLQDFYSHSSWAEITWGEKSQIEANKLLGRAQAGSPREPADLGFATVRQQTCTTPVANPFEMKLIVPVLLTSGYFPGEDLPLPTSPDKCLHGGVAVWKQFDIRNIDINTVLFRGINKDTRDRHFSPSHEYHDAAAIEAVWSTRQFLKDVATELTDDQFKDLLGFKGTLNFVMDTSGALSATLATLGSAVGDTLANLGDQPRRYVLSNFGDQPPATGSVDLVETGDAFDQALSTGFANDASGGSDCTGYSMTGVLRGLAASEPGSVLFLVTGSAAADADVFDSAAGLAAAKKVQVYPMLKGSCAAGDAIYTRLARNTGGMLLVLADDNEVKSASELLATTLARDDAVQLLSVVDRYASEKTYEVPVDQLTELTVLVSSTGPFPSVTLIDGDGIPIMPDDPGVNYTLLSHAVAISVAQPAPGTWRVAVANSPGDTFVKVGAISALHFHSFEMGQAGHMPLEAPSVVPGSPLRNQEILATADMSNGVADYIDVAQLTLRGPDFAQVQAVPAINNGEPGADPAAQTGSVLAGLVDRDQYYGQLALPNPDSPFMAYVSGTYVSAADQSEYSFQRVVPQLIATQSAMISSPERRVLRAGKTTTLTFQAKNYGTTRRFALSFIDDKGFVGQWTPNEVELGTGASVNVTVKITAPEGTAAGTSDTVVATLKALDDPTVKNNSAINLWVTDVPQAQGKPGVVMEVLGLTQVSSGRYEVDLRFRGMGPGTAENLRITKLDFKTLQPGSGTATYSNPSLALTLPFDTPNFDDGAGLTVRLNLNVPTTVKRFSVTASGSLRAIDGTTYSFSQSQVIQP